MRKTMLPFFTVVALLVVASCSNDFLEENKKQIDGYHLDGYLFVNPSTDFSEVAVTLPDLKNKDFKVLQYPKIIHFKSFNGHIDEAGNLTFNIKVDNFDSPVSVKPTELGDIILNVSDFGLLSIPVVNINYGIPKASVSEGWFDFDISRDAKEFRVENYENGVLFYKLSQKPSWIRIGIPYVSNEWLEIDSVKVLSPNSLATYNAIPDVEGLSPGIHEGEIVFETSDPSKPVLRINVKIRIRTYENPETMIPVEGVVVDAEFDRNSNTAIIITQNPAKLIAWNVDTRTKKEKVLDRSPYSVGLTEDGKTILVGESAQMQLIDLSTLVVKEKIVLPYIVADVVDGENGFYYLANKEGEVYSFNTITKTLKNQLNLSPYGYKTEADVLLKVKNKPQLAFSRTFSFPNGFYLIDASVPDDLKFLRYWHDSYGNKLLTSENFEYLFSYSTYIYKFPDENTGDGIYKLGELELKKLSTNFFNWMHHSSVKSAIWTSYQEYDYSRYRNKGMISEYDDKTFSLKRSFELNDYVATYKGVKDYYNTSANYIFATKDGNKLLLIKTIYVDYTQADAWHLEIIDVIK